MTFGRPGRHRWLQPPKAFCTRYGDALARVVARHAGRARATQALPRTTDVAFTLQRIADERASLPPGPILGPVRAALSYAAWQCFAVQGTLRDLSRAELAVAARAALAGLQSRGGRRQTRHLQVELVRDLLAAGAGGLRGEALLDLIADALMAAGLVRQLQGTARVDAPAAAARTARELLRLARKAG